MQPYYEDDLVTLYHGDCAEVMADLAPESVDAVITSPPYAMQRKGTYGGVPECDYPQWTVKWMSEARSVLRPDGSAVINIRPHVRNGQISDYTLRTRLALREDGWAEIEELIWDKKNGVALGHVGRPRRSWESLHWFARHGRPFCDPKAAGRASEWSARYTGQIGPHIHQKDWRLQREQGVARVPDMARISIRKNENHSELNNHPAPYPPALAEWIAHLICPPGGVVLDPFSGSASTGVACVRNGWRYIGIDASEQYVEMSRRRLQSLEAT